MGLAATSSTKGVKPITVRRNVERKILRFSLCIGAVTTLIAVITYGIALRSDLRDPHKVNMEALAEMQCGADGCETSKFTTDPYTDSPDYVVDPETRYLLSTPGSAPDTATRLASLDFADPAFVRRFRQPDSYDSLDRERWRLFSRPAVMGNKSIEIIIGYAEKQPTKIPGNKHGLRLEVASETATSIGILAHASDRFQCSARRQCSNNGAGALLSAQDPAKSCHPADGDKIVDWLAINASKNGLQEEVEYYRFPNATLTDNPHTRYFSTAWAILGLHKAGCTPLDSPPFLRLAALNNTERWNMAASF